MMDSLQAEIGAAERRIAELEAERDEARAALSKSLARETEIEAALDAARNEAVGLRASVNMFVAWAARAELEHYLNGDDGRTDGKDGWGDLGEIVDGARQALCIVAQVP